MEKGLKCLKSVSLYGSTGLLFQSIWNINSTFSSSPSLEADCDQMTKEYCMGPPLTHAACKLPSFAPNTESRRMKACMVFNMTGEHYQSEVWIALPPRHIHIIHLTSMAILACSYTSQTALHPSHTQSSAAEFTAIVHQWARTVSLSMSINDHMTPLSMSMGSFPCLSFLVTYNNIYTRLDTCTRKVSPLEDHSHPCYSLMRQHSTSLDSNCQLHL